MAEDGIVGNYNGSQAREVLLTIEQWAEMNGQKDAAPAAPPEPRSGRVLTVSNRSTPQIDDEEDDDFATGELNHEAEDDAEVEDSEVEEDDEADEADDEAAEEDLDEQDSALPRYRRGRESA
jgi:S-DNA-T family DNA segregation ATPase FtsK/SpoIIIE